MENIIHVDAIVQEAEKLINSFYEHDDAPENESRTAYVFTADHGMSAIGNHGDGDPDNTRTPLIAWGSGIRGPVPDPDSNSTHDSYSKPAWGQPLTDLARADVQQADVAALMSALLGVDWPMNSVGVVPGLVNGPGYIKETDNRGSEQMARIGVVNARAILEQYRVKHAIKAKHHLRYKSFPPLEPYAAGALPPGALELREIDRLLAAGDWQTARQKAQHLIDITLEGLGYLQRSLGAGAIIVLGLAGDVAVPFKPSNYDQLTGWILLVSSVVLPIFLRPSAPSSTSKLQQYFLAFGPLFVLLSISTEGLFYASFSLTLFLWVEVEAKLHQQGEKAVPKQFVPKPTERNIGWRAEALKRTLDEDQHEQPRIIKAPTLIPRSSRGLSGADVRRALFFLFFVQVAFFGAANVASVS
ncbi:phosphatidylinositolglycan class N protein, partial [Rhizoctonia solani AG-3 Rhs1AP]